MKELIAVLPSLTLGIFYLKGAVGLSERSFWEELEGKLRMGDDGCFLVKRSSDYL